jgi:lysophospholipase L1-like esterase
MVATQLLSQPENRIEAWLKQRRSNLLILLAILVAVWFVFDSLAALGLTMAGFGPPDGFFVTRLFHPRQVVDPDARQIVAMRGPSDAEYMDRFQADGLLGQRLVPGFLTTRPPPWSGWVLPSFWFMTNAQGFPPVEPGAPALRAYAIPKPAGVFRLVILGGSTVEGNGVNSPFDSLPAKLRGGLQQRFDGAAHPGFDRIEVVNAGVSNYASDQEYLHLLADVLPLQPDLVVVYDGWNDAEVLPSAIAGNAETRYYRPASQADNADRVSHGFTVSGSLRNFAAMASGHALADGDGFATFYVIHKGVGFVMKRVAAVVASKHQDPSGFNPAPSITTADLYQQNRERMLFLARQTGFRFASILQPIMTVDQKSYAPAEQVIADGLSNTQRRERTTFYEAVRPRLAALAQRETIDGKTCFGDLSTKSFAGHPEQVYADSGHLNPTGNAIVASKLIAELDACHLLWPSADK